MADEIASQLRKASDAYYNTGHAIMTDDEFDALKEKLAKIAPKHPFLKQVGAPVVRGVKVELPYWMGSLDKIRDDEKSLEKWKAKYPGTYTVSDKLDGISAMIAGSRMYTRGDGYVGQDITHVMPLIKGAKTVNGIAVRGELIISRKNWDKIKDLGANARNMVSGFVNANHPDPFIGQHIEFVAYELLHPASTGGLNAAGYKVVAHETVDSATLSTVFLSKKLVERRRDSDYDIDGLVVIHDGMHRVTKGKNPAYGFAFKSLVTHEEAEVVVTEVTWNASKDGYLKPLVHFAPVSIAGVTISKATGFNAQYIEANIIGPGARIVIIRSGDVIPHILRVISPAAAPQFPENTEWEWNTTHVDIVVSAETNDVALQRMVHFCKTLDVKHVAAGTLRKMFEAGVNTIPKLLAVTVTDLLRIEGIKEKSAERIVQGIGGIRAASCARLMAASNIFGRGLGEKKIELILAAYPYGEALDAASVSDIASVQGIGPVTSNAFIEALPEFRSFIGDTHLIASCDAPTVPKDTVKMTVVFTGFRNKELEAAIIRAGGKVTTTVSRNTTLIVAADPKEDSEKLRKARDIGIKIVSKDEFTRTICAT